MDGRLCLVQRLAVCVRRGLFSGTNPKTTAKGCVGATTRSGGCGLLPSQVYHQQLPTTVAKCEVDATKLIFASSSSFWE